MKVVIGIPVIYCPICIERCINHTKDQADLFFIDNSKDLKIKRAIQPYNKIVNPKNVYVNPAWNQIMERFLQTEYDLLVIMNSDLYLKSDCIQKLKELDIENNKIIPCLNLVHTYTDEPRVITHVNDGVAGVFIALTKAMAKEVYPIPDQIRLWFGDNWIFEKLKKIGYKFTIYSDMQAIHNWSTSVGQLPEAQELILKDCEAWHQTVQTMI